MFSNFKFLFRRVKGEDEGRGALKDVSTISVGAWIKAALAVALIIAGCVVAWHAGWVPR